MRASRLAAALFLTAGLITVPSAPASAGHGTWYRPDNVDQYISGDSLTARGVLGRDRGKAQLERSDITTHWGNNDIDVRDAYYGTVDGFFGRTTCTNEGSGDKCDVFVVKFNESMLPSTDWIWRYTGCHEFGHTGSLVHRYPGSSDSDNNSCMREDYNSIPTPSLDGHDINAINANV